MFDLDDPEGWANAFGLAEAPLFAATASSRSTTHRVLLDGGYGTFAISVQAARDEERESRASWIWSSDIPHHVLVTPQHVVVVRWDDQTGERLFVRATVERRIEEFYRFLVLDRVTEGRRVVEHTVGLFRLLRALIPDADKAGKSVDAFLLLLGAMIDSVPLQSSALRALGSRYSLPADATTALLSAPMNALEALIQEHQAIQIGVSKLRLHPDLAIRHAGGVIFQEAHFEILRTATPDLFGYVPQPDVKPHSRGGVHFTPPALARSIVEQALSTIDAVHNRNSLVLTDPACGSGAFLIEAIRSLRRAEFKGALTICGRDISEHAIAMARFAVNRSISDWTLSEPITVDLKVMDSLTAEAVPQSDIIVMNPPFGSWPSMEENQRDQVREILGNALHGRADLSMAFVLVALNSLRPGGAFGALFPASLLSLQSARGWRSAIAERAEVHFLASLGDYGLFEYALVQVGGIVATKGRPSSEVTTLWTKDGKATTGDALRALRQKTRGAPAIAPGKYWHISSVSASSFKDASTWRISSVHHERLLLEVGKAVQTKVQDLFDVHQGIRTGANDVFLLTEADWKKLPRGEREWFRLATMNNSIREGRIHSDVFVFYPYVDNELAFKTEDALLRALPRYARGTLLPNKQKLSRRSSLHENREWWELSEKRAWLSESIPRIVSKYFGERGGFAFDSAGRLAVVQGFAWIPNASLSSTEASSDSSGRDGSFAWLAAYAALFNSKIFERLLDAASPQVAGGQYDLSPRYVGTIPLPNLQEESLNPSLGSFVRRLDLLGSEIRLDDTVWRDSVDELVALVYRTKLSAWDQP
jgi:predicted RNA methylase